MALFSSTGSIFRRIVRNIGSKRRSKKTTVTTKDIPAKEKEPVRSVDVGTSTTARTGGYTVKGSGSSSRVVSTSGSVRTKSQAQQIEASRGKDVSISKQEVQAKTQGQAMTAKDVRELTPAQIEKAARDYSEKRYGTQSRATREKPAREYVEGTVGGLKTTPSGTPTFTSSSGTEITPQQTFQEQESRFQARQRSAQELVFGESQRPTQTFGTARDYGKPKLPPGINTQILLPGTIYERQIGTVGGTTGEWSGRGFTRQVEREPVPVMGTFTIGKIGELPGGGAVLGEREATKEEKERFKIYREEEYSKSQAEKTLALNINPKTGEPYSRSRIVLRGETEELKGKISKASRLQIFDQKKVEEQISGGYQKIGFGEKTSDFIGGLVGEAVPSTSGEAALVVGTFGAGAAIGAGARGATYALTKIPKYGRTVATTFQLGTYAAGAGITTYYTGSKIKNYISAETSLEKGRVVGGTIREVVPAVTGFRAGQKGFDIYLGRRATTGRAEIKIPQGEYPTDKISKHLELFQKNIYPELSGKPGAFHTTGQRFWKGGKISPDVGASEIAGLYGSTKFSTPFARIPGSTSTSKFNLQNIWKGLTTLPGDPGVAFLTPKGFRSSRVKYSPNKLFEGQKYVRGKGYAYFSSSPRAGYADVPGIKPEIETLFRPGAGGYSYVSGGYYVELKGVRVPVDVFKYDSTVPVGGGGSPNLVGGASAYSGGPGLYSSAVYSPTMVSGVLSSTSNILDTSSLSIPSITSQTTSSVSSPSIKSSSVVPSSKYLSGYSSSPKSSKKSSSIISSVVKKSYIKPSSIIDPSSYKKSYAPGYSYRPSPSPIGEEVYSPSYYKPGYASPLKYSFKGIAKRKIPKPKFTVFLRRFGKFKPVGYARTSMKAFEIGKGAAARTLGATFKVEGQGIKVPSAISGFYKKKTKKGELVFIEKPKYRLSKPTEIKEIQFAKLNKNPIKIPKIGLKGGKS